MRPKLKIQNMKGQLSPVSGQKAWGKGQNDVTTTRETESASWRQVGWSYHHHRPTIALFSSSYHCFIFIIVSSSSSYHCFIFIIVPLLYFHHCTIALFHYCIIIKMGPRYMRHKFSPDQKWSLSKLITRVRPNSKNIFENIVLQKYSMINFGLQEYFSLFVGKLWKLKMSSWSRFKVKQETSLPLSHEYVIARTFARFEREKSGDLAFNTKPWISIARKF